MAHFAEDLSAITEKPHNAYYPHMTPDDLIEMELIRQLKYRYARCLDTKQWDQFEDILTPDATAAYSGGAHSFDGRDAIIAFMVESMGSTNMLTSHTMTSPEIRLLSPTTAEGTWALRDEVVMLDWQMTVRGAAYYEDRYVKLDGRWWIQHTGYRRIYEEIFGRGDISSLRLTAHWWDTDGRSTLGG